MGIFSFFQGENSYSNSYSNEPTGGFSIPWSLVIGAIFGVIFIGLIIYIVLSRAMTRPVTEGFVEQANDLPSDLPCGQASSEANQLLYMFSSRGLDIKNEDYRDLRNLLSKLCCLKVDLTSSDHTITAVKELGFSNDMDIQPVADLTGRCFSKTIPQRDLSIQFIKWRDFGGQLLRRLCTELSLDKKDHLRAERLFLASWTNVNDLANRQCLSGPAVGVYKTDPDAPTDSVDQGDEMLRPYDGFY